MSVELVKNLQSDNRILRKEVDVLRRENSLLRAALQKETIEQRKRFEDVKDRFNFLDRFLIDMVLMLTSETLISGKKFEGIHYTEVTKALKNKFPSLRRYQDETIRRRLQYLAQNNYLNRPQDAHYSPGNIKLPETQE